MRTFKQAIALNAAQQEEEEKSMRERFRRQREHRAQNEKRQAAQALADRCLLDLLPAQANVLAEPAAEKKLTFSYCTASLVMSPLFFSFRSQSATAISRWSTSFTFCIAATWPRAPRGAGRRDIVL